MSHSKDNLMESLTAVFRADPKKTGSLLVLLAILGMSITRQFMTGSQARPNAAAGASASSTGGGSLGATDLTPAHSAAAAEALDAWSHGPVLPINRNLFAVRIEYFPLDGSRTSQIDGGDEGFWSRLAKSLTQRTDEKVRQENLIASFMKEAEKLQLQSTLPEAQRAMISGKLVGIGSVVADFRVVSIEPRKVIVEREGITLAIQMKEVSRAKNVEP